jgi:hypothetical protein
VPGPQIPAEIGTRPGTADLHPSAKGRKRKEKIFGLPQSQVVSTRLERLEVKERRGCSDPWVFASTAGAHKRGGTKCHIGLLRRQVLS